MITSELIIFSLDSWDSVDTSSEIIESLGISEISSTWDEESGFSPPLIWVKYEIIWFNVGYSDKTKFSSKGKPKNSLKSAIISACLTESTPNSPSKS